MTSRKLIPLAVAALLASPSIALAENTFRWTPLDQSGRCTHARPPLPERKPHHCHERHDVRKPSDS